MAGEIVNVTVNHTRGPQGIQGLQGVPGEVTDAELTAGLALKANIANPTFTGNVIVPTADADTEALNRITGDGRYIQETEVDASIKTLVLPDNTTISDYGKLVLISADAATARALLDAASNTDVALKAPLANPTFTGNVIVPNADVDEEALNRFTADARYIQETEVDASIKTLVLPDNTTISDYIQTLLNVADAQAVLTALGSPSISSGAAAPATTPTKIGDIYIETTLDTMYYASDTASSADWELVGAGTGGGTTGIDGGLAATIYGGTTAINGGAA